MGVERAGDPQGPSEQTSRAYSLFEVVSQPQSGPTPHIQHREDECFYVLEGEYEFLLEGRTLRRLAGSLFYIPKGTLQAHKNVEEGMGRMLVSQTPGGQHERFFEEVGEEPLYWRELRVFTTPESFQRAREIAAGYSIEIPPLSDEQTPNQRNRNETFADGAEIQIPGLPPLWIGRTASRRSRFRPVRFVRWLRTRLDPGTSSPSSSLTRGLGRYACE